MDQQTLLAMFRVMVRIREFENEAIELAKSNATRAAVHTYNGQEAVAAGVCAHMTSQDYITSTHRGHGHCVAKGADLEKMFAELLGREAGYCKGKGGSMHIADLATGNLGANGIVGGGIPIAVGAGLSLHFSHSSHYVVSFFGDGATNEGAFHEALNMASIWDLPVIFVCENNQYGISTNVSQSTHVGSLADRAKAYGMRGEYVDGNDVLAVYDAMQQAVEHVKAGKGPVFLEMRTYRMAGHYFGDNQNYRTKEEVESWKQKDPIQRCEKILQAEYGVDADTIAAIYKEEAKQVVEASARAKLLPEPNVEDLTDDLYDPTFADIQWVAFQMQPVTR
jgi:pyruvate dehydrogenase E1 component alpha subunit